MTARRPRGRSALVLATAFVASGVFLVPGAPAARAAVLKVRTVPPLAGVRIVRPDGKVFVTGPRGTVIVRGYSGHTRSLRVPPTVVEPGVRARLGRWRRAIDSQDGRVLGLEVDYRVRLSTVDLQGNPVDPRTVGAVTLKSTLGISAVVRGGAPVWLIGTRTVNFGGHVEAKQIQWRVESATVRGTNIVNRAQQRFLPLKKRHVTVQLLFYRARFSARDALFRVPIGSAIRLRFPNGRVEQHALSHDGTLTLSSLPRGDYVVTVVGPGFSFARPVAISRDQDVKLQVLSYADLGVIALLLASVAAALVLAPRPKLRRFVGRLPLNVFRVGVLSLPARRRVRRGASAGDGIVDLYPELDTLEVRSRLDIIELYPGLDTVELRPRGSAGPQRQGAGTPS